MPPGNSFTPSFLLFCHECSTRCFLCFNLTCHKSFLIYPANPLHCWIFDIEDWILPFHYSPLTISLLPCSECPVRSINTSSRLASFISLRRSTAGDKIINQFIRGIHRNDFAFIDDRHPVAEVFCFIHIMRGDDYGSSFFPDGFYQFHKLLLACGSRPVVGSSRKMILGWLISVVATEKRCFCPPLSSFTFAFALSFRFTISSSSIGSISRLYKPQNNWMSLCQVQAG